MGRFGRKTLFLVIALTLLPWLIQSGHAAGDDDHDGLDDGLEATLAAAYFPAAVWFHPDETCAWPAGPVTPGMAAYHAQIDPRNPRLISLTYTLHYRRDCGSPFRGIDSHIGDVETFGLTFAPDAACPLGWQLYAIRAVAHGGGPANIEETVLQSCSPAPEIFVSLSKHATYLTIAQCEAYLDPFQVCDRGFSAPFNLVQAGEDAYRLADDLSAYFPPEPGAPADYLWLNPGDGLFCGGVLVSDRRECVGAAANKFSDPEKLAPVAQFTPIFSSGEAWRIAAYPTDLAFGDVDGDGRAEVVVARYDTGGARAALLDDATADFSLLAVLGSDWLTTEYATAVAVGDVDGDGLAEVAVGRSAESGPRLFLLDDAQHGFALLFTLGRAWGRGSYPAALAFGDVDGDGRAELGIARHANSGDRLLILDDAVAGFAPLWADGADWGAGRYPTDLAFGDVDGDGRDEVAFTRYTRDGDRLRVLDDNLSGFAPLFSAGAEWAANQSATTLALGDVDGDGRAEITLGRRASSGDRLFVFDDAAAAFSLLHTAGADWELNAYPTALALSDVDGDGRAETLVGRAARAGGRIFLLDDALAWQPFAWSLMGGSDWPTGQAATAVAWGDVDGDGWAEAGVAHANGAGPRWQVWEVTYPPSN